MKRYKETELINEFPNKWWTKIVLTGCWKSYRDNGTVNWLTASGRPRSAALKKMLICFWVKKIRHILTERSVKSHARHSVNVLWNYHHEFGSCLLLEHSTIYKSATDLNIWVSRSSAATHFRCSGIFIYCSVANLKFWKSVKIWQNYRHSIGWRVF